MKKGKFSSKKLLSLALYSATVVGTVGAIAGTYAWYSYNNFAYVTYNGTSVSETKGLEIGIVDAGHSDGKQEPTTIYFNTSTKKGTAKTYGELYKNDFNLETRGEDEDTRIYWCGTEIFDDFLADYLDWAGYASKEMTPVTSGSYKGNAVITEPGENVEFDLYKNPTKITTKAEMDAAHMESVTTNETYKFMKVQFAFRVKDVDTGEYKTNFDIKLADVTAVGQENIGKALRIHVQDPANTDEAVTNNIASGNGSIINPNNTSEKDELLRVGGLLNLDAALGDEYFDSYSETSYIEDHGKWKYETTRKEVVYGEIEEASAGYTTPARTADSKVTNYYYLETDPATDPTVYEDEPAPTITTFTARHKRGVQEATFTAKTAKTMRKNTATYQDSFLCTTVADSTDYGGGVTKSPYATLDFTAWIEGWDCNVIDSAASQAFSLALKFGFAEHSN